MICCLNVALKKTEMILRNKLAQILLLLIINLISLGSFGQNIITGVLLDNTSKQPIVGVNITDENSKYGTVTNEDGEFQMNVKTLPAKLIFSHVSYNKVVKIIDNSAFQQFFLSIAVVQLPEARSGNPAILILNAVVNKAVLDTNKRTFYKAFYQRVSEQNGKYTKLQEMFMNVSWSQFGVEKWQPTNARFAQIDAQGYKNPNISILSFLNSAVIHKQTNFPLNNISVTEIYNYKIKQYINFGTEEEIAVIACTSKSKVSNVFQFIGDIFVSTKKDNLVRISGKIIYPKTRMGSRILTLILNFKEDSSGYSIFDNLYMLQNVGKKVLSKGDSEKIWFFFQEEIERLSDEKTYPAFVRDDLKVLTASPYNATFWQENVPLKHTKLEKEVIQYFEKKQQFTSNF